jgi:methyl-accepting chemotaxis protein
MRRTLKDLTIRQRLHIPNALYLILIAIVVFLFFHSNALFGRLSDEQRHLSEISVMMRDTAYRTKDYINGQIDFEALKAKYDDLTSALDDPALRETFSAIWEQVVRVREIEDRNATIETEIGRLTDHSIEQSNAFLQQVSEKLADEYERESVSRLERLVIAGASVNTSSSYDVKLLFERLKGNLKLEDQLLTFLDTLLQNVEQDYQRLEGTPFADMARTARESNQRVRELCLEYIGNMKTLQMIQASVLGDIEKSLAAVDAASMAGQTSLFERIRLYFLLIVALMAVTALFGIGLSVYLARSIAGALGEAVTVTRRIAGGDLTGRIEVKGNDEIAQLMEAMERMKGRLQDIIDGVKSAADGVSVRSRWIQAGSDELTATAQTLSQGANQQAASSQELSSSMEEMASNIRQNAENAFETEKIAQKAATEAKEGAEAVGKTVEAMREISNKILVVEEIARQTNLLALNAAIEAARAQEHGKGFAVVAHEVRKLAENTQKAAARISKLSESSMDVAETAREMLDRILPDIGRTADLVQEISAASNEQKVGADHINQALQQLDVVIQQNAQAAEELSATAVELSSGAQEMAQVQVLSLQEAVSHFKIETRTRKSDAETESAARWLKDLDPEQIERIGRLVELFKGQRPASDKSPTSRETRKPADTSPSDSGFDLKLSDDEVRDNLPDTDFQKY